MEVPVVGLRTIQYWITFGFLFIFYFVCQDCSGEGDPKKYLINNFNNKEQASRSYYPANFKRFRRGYGGAEEKEASNFGQFPVNNAQPPFGTYQRRGGASHIRKGGSRNFGSRPFGGPDSFLSAAREEKESEDEPLKQSYHSSNRALSSIGNSGKGWPMSFSNGRGKSGGAAKIPADGYNFRTGNRRFESEGNHNLFSKPGSSSSYSSSRSSNSGLHFGKFGSNSKSQAIMAGNAFQHKSSIPVDIRNTIGKSSKMKNVNDEKPIVFGSQKNTDEKIEDLTGGNIIGSLGNFNAEDLVKLLRQFESTTTTKKPNRIMLDEDKDKIFSGGQNIEHTGFGAMENMSAMKSNKHFPKGVSNKFFERDLSEDCKDPTAINAKVKCITNSECRLDCFPNYKTPSGGTFIYLKCIERIWYDASGLTEIQNCEPVCNPACRNDGICLSPNVCTCPDDWEGPICDQSKISESMKCSNKPPTPMNSKIFCRADECLARCKRGYEFEEGISSMTFVCKMGSWEVENDIGSLEPDCRPTCENPCQNGGICIIPNVCECSNNFRGPDCQYPVSNCDPLKLNFNGGHNCTGEGMSFGCKFWCPVGINFTFPASNFYKCDYATAKWSPSPVPECDYSFLNSQTFEQYRKKTTLEKQTAKSGTCFTWSNSHYKTFDGEIYSFESSCSFTLLQDSSLGTFTVNLIPEQNCLDRQCKKSLRIFTEGDTYTLTADSDQPVLTYRESSLVIPGQINDLVSEKIAHFIILQFTGIGLTIKWDLEHFIILEISDSLWNRTGGLCGTRDGSRANDISKMGKTQTNLVNFLGTWQADTLLEKCSEFPITTPKCSEIRIIRGKEFCSRINKEQRFHKCRQVLDASDYVRTCEWDYCNCQKVNSEECACQSISAFVKECTTRGQSIQDSWRTEDFCPMNCIKGLQYKTCLPVVQPRCGQPSDSAEPAICIEGCDCPSGTVKNDADCIKPENCPCTYHNKTYSAWDVIPNDCNTCTCISGKWTCTEVKCGARCSAVGDPHYKTFDGRRFDFMGSCSYYLVKGDEFSIEAENVPCAGAISERMAFPKYVLQDFPSCTKSITLRVPGTTVEMKQKGEITINGVEVTGLPIFEGEIYIKKASSLFTLASLPNHIEVWWDGQNRVYVDAPPEMRSKTAGLCGTFNDNQKDDFLTPEADIEQNAISFANKWKTMEKCPDNPLVELRHPCERHVQRKNISEKYCIRLKSRVFSKCHYQVDPDPHYRNCQYDMCSCETKLSDCLCPILASYGKECTDKGIIMDWRSSYRECGLHCKNGQKYQNCGDSCTYSCYDISINPNCKSKCVEGCTCPEGFTFDAKEECIPISHCPCLHEGREYIADYELMHHADNLKICKCKKAQWNCRVPTEIEMSSPDFFTLPQVKCLDTQNEIHTNCVPGEEITCKNMHLRPELPPDTCREGCVCEIGFVRNIDTQFCVKSTSCPCHHGGKSYQEDEKIIEECNTCICRGGVWKCSEEDCPARCTSWGDSHFKTFDGRIYDFFGICDYMLAKGKISKTDSFEVTIQNIPCGSYGVTCAKSILLRIGYGDKQEVITFSRNKPVRERNMTRTIIREVGSFIFAEVADMGLVLQWDKGTIAYITLHPSWKNKVKGLCGNYNENEKDDFQTPSGGVAEESSKVFSDSWRLQNRCPESIVVHDSCALHPHRKLWALGKCAILQSNVFSPCHSEVPVEPYVERCQFDACACDMGGDCHCLCTAISAYAQECNVYGAPIKWRRPDFCPMQCDESCKTYHPCITACPTENCESDYSQKQSLCHLETCIEGCAKETCLPGEVYASPTKLECVPKTLCNKTCLILEDIVFYEGDIVSEDACHTCFCMNHRKVCKGVPCTNTLLLTTSSFHVNTPTSFLEYSPVIPEIENCNSGWSPWLNNDHPTVYSKNSDIEHIPNIILKTADTEGFCERNMVTDIRCRSLGHHQPPLADVECNLVDGLICIGPKGSTTCKDYEISVLCDCSATQILWNISTLHTEIFTTQEPDTDKMPTSCEINGWSSWMNSHQPSGMGEYETIDELRKTISICPDQYIIDVECRPTKGPSNIWTNCSKNGAVCSVNGRNSKHCTDYEIRILCKCECQDRIGVEFRNKIMDDQLSSSSFYEHRGPEFGRLNGASSWVPSKNVFRQISEEEQYGTDWLQVDLKKRTEITGILTQGSSDGYIQKFSIQTSLNGNEWKNVKQIDETYAHVFTGNNDSFGIVRNIFPSSVVTRFLRVIPLDFKFMPALRIELTGCHEDEITVSTDKPSTIQIDTSAEACITRWTPWINTNTPSPKDWNDIESFENIRKSVTLCDNRAITKVECRVAGVHTSIKDAGQVDILCNKNHGLQCIDVLQTWHCYDYEIRFFCDCGIIQPLEISISTIPTDVEMLCKPRDIHVQHATDCQKFFKCDLSNKHKSMVEETCAMGTLFNPFISVCDFPYAVYKIRPECLDFATTALRPTSTTQSPCWEHYWTDWFNVSHPNIDNGDYENLEAIVDAGFEHCAKKFIMDVQCQFEAKVRKTYAKGKGGKRFSRNGKYSKGRHDFDMITELQDYSKSRDYEVTCTIRDGLSCNNSLQAKWRGGICEDYSIRFLCSCESKSTTKLTTLPVSTTTLETYSDFRTSYPRTTQFMLNDYRCPPGRYYEEFAIRCSRVCIYYRQLLIQHGKCLDNNEKAPACLEEKYGQACPTGLFLRDKSTCVNIFDCNCMLHNNISAPPGKALLVSDCEICQCLNNNLVCDNSKCFGKPMEFSCDEWTPWMSISTPSGEGDDETLVKLRINNPNICWNPSNIQCRDKKSRLTANKLGQNILCDTSVGLLCYNWQNIEMCKDYEIRIICPCSAKEDEPTGVVKPKTDCQDHLSRVVDCGAQCEDFCNEQEVTLQQQGYCQKKYECVPACLRYGQSEVCPESSLISANWTCVPVKNCSCKLPDGRTVKAGADIWISQCEKCKCIINSLRCETTKDCLESGTQYETTPVNDIEGTVSGLPFNLPSTTLPANTLPPGRNLVQLKCDDWTPWMNIKRGYEGDFQKLVDLQVQYEDLCEVPINISCRETNSKLPADQLKQVFICDPKIGFICRNSENKENCYDYEISLFCECPKVVEQTEQPTKEYGISLESVPCATWSPWINEHHPWGESGDTEFKNKYQLREEFGFCTEGHIADIECIEAASELSLNVNKNVHCNMKYGLRCRNKDQISQICLDFKIRYYCACDAKTTSRVSILVPLTVSPPSKCDPSSYINLLDDVSDSSFISTSDQSLIYSAANARMNNPKDAISRAWIPKSSDLGQFLQIDLGAPKLIYGLIVGGSVIAKARVTTYSVQISNNELSWSIVEPAVLRGPVSSKDNQKAMFEYPVESRYIKILPLTWDHSIALRVEVIGCSDSIPTSITKTEGPLICSDDMGVLSGLLRDSQITVSSVFNDNEEYYGKENIRLNSQRAWVAKTRQSQLTEFVQFDFLQLTRISGVKIQGRYSRKEWVESFIIKYTSDNKIWSTILNKNTGENKIFMANYDSDTVVTILFDIILETRYMKLIPLTWNERIALRLEIIGCFKPYPAEGITEVTTKTTVMPPSACDACPQLPPELYSRCLPCFSGHKFDGNHCIPELLCPCYYDGKPYTLGSEFETADCQQCTCDLNGISTCDPIKCESCDDENERPITTAFCKCLCKPCPENTRLCPSNNFCLEIKKWCDGVTNCPDDEVHCPTKLPSVSLECPTSDCPEEWKVVIKTSLSGVRCPQYDCKPLTIITPIPCQPPICPMEYVIVIEEIQEEEVCPKYNCVLPATTMATFTCPPVACPIGYESEISQSLEQFGEFQDYDRNKETCSKFRCIAKVPPTAPCPPPNCPSGYKIEYGGIENMMELCPIYECTPKVTTTMCPPVICPEGLETMYIESSDLCPQHTCIKITTLSSLPEMSTMAPCAKAFLPICEPGEEIYQANPTEHCPIFKCKIVGSLPKTTAEPPKTTFSSCRIEGTSLTTFDGRELYDIWTCNHVLARNKITKKWNISVLQNCILAQKSCSLATRITQNKSTIELTSDLNIIWKNYTYRSNQANMIGTSSREFSLFHLGTSLIFSSKIYNFSVIWNFGGDIKIEINNKLVYQVDGLCGQYTGHTDDDLSKPDGKIATSIKEFKESWFSGDTECTDTDVKCTKEESAEAFRLCTITDSDPFMECHDIQSSINFVKKCIANMCACLKNVNSKNDCRCNVISSYVTSCLEKKPQAKLANWRIAAKCYKECPAGEEYHDCYNYACEQSCSSKDLYRSCADSLKTSCISGCFCEPGLIRKNDTCVLPELCRDCICESFGDSHYMTYDRLDYSLISDCSYIITRERDQIGEHAFEIKVKNELCNNSLSNCNKMVSILFNKHELQLNAINSAIQTIFDGNEIREFPTKKSTAKIDKLDPDHVFVFIEGIQLEVIFSLDNRGLMVRVPSSVYSGRLEGLCGNCNNDSKDDFLTSGGQIATLKNFGQAWITGNKNCRTMEKKECSQKISEDDPCYKIMDLNIFGKCHPIEDPIPYLTSCQLDDCRWSVQYDTFCQTLEAYASRCSQMGICLDWRSDEICPKNCSAGLKYLPCGPGCIKTCDNFQELENDMIECTQPKIDGCFCENGMVKENEECISREACIVCDAKGHRGGDVWKTSPCTTCECSPDKGGIICNTKACAPKPICNVGLILVEEQNATDDCCGPKKICELKPTEACPVTDKPIEECPFGKHYKLIRLPEIPCPEYICVCLERSDCPEMLNLSDEDLRDGEVWELDSTGCCDHFIKKCTGLCSKLDCQPFYHEKERKNTEKNCCPELYCAAPEDSCIYKNDYSVEFPIQGQLHDLEDIEVHKLGEKWKDGSCIDCECVRDHSNTPHAKCITKTCPSMESHPDRKEYRLIENYSANKCCPEITRLTCIEDGDSLKVNDTYFDPTNGCRSVECKMSGEGRIEKIEHMFSCSHDCPLGWEYMKSPLYPQICCGDCHQVACENSGKIKHVGEHWMSEDFCTYFTCEREKGKINIRTKQKQCHEPTPEDETKYVYNQTVLDEECCVKYEITDCIANGVTLAVGYEIYDMEDSCIIYSCEYKESKISLKEKEKSCITECPLGNIYVNPKINSNECCGSCMQTQCVDNEELHLVGDTWENPNEQCFQYTCQIRDGTLTTVAIKRECPYFDPDCPKDKIIKDSCCRICNATRETKKECQTEEIPADETIGIFILEASQVGKCTNHEPVRGFKKCNGQCDSGTVFIAEGTSASHESECDCCKPSRFSSMKVPLKCQQGYSFDRIFVNIESCECQECQSKKGNYLNDEPVADETLFHVPIILNDDLS